ncbi:MAG: S-layer homology domain-containing protein [Oscillospiraceae bacterium]|jgi:uncharacterized repeat protein (TIGR02543 family)|nr:S-layer homology domain-containing protein [Oscillospiraceae bacterium]
MKKFCSLFVCVMLFVTCSVSSLASGGNPFTDAFSVQYNPMTDAVVSEKLNAVPLAPEGGGVLPQLSGRTYKITNEQGLELELVFAAQGAGVSLSANLPPVPFFETEFRQETFESEYAGLAAGDFVLVGFRKPDTARAWAVVLNLKSGLAAAYEVFFAENEWGTPAREAQRNVYLGKAEGVGSSAQEPSATNRLTGKAILWKNDLGSFYTNYGTRSWSAFYPLGQPEGLAGSWTAPSDYLDFHDARHFLYSRTETYYSGATLVELLDMHLVRQIGLKIGFDAADKLAFTLYSGTGEILGSYAAYGGFATDELVGNPAFRFGYRPNSEKLEKDEVTEIIKAEGSWTGAFGGAGKEEKMYPLSDKLNGKSFSLAFDDGLTLEYQIAGTNELTFRERGVQDWKTVRYEAFEVDANLIFFTHAIDDAIGDVIDGATGDEIDDFPDKIYLNVVDFDNGLATCMNSEILVDEVTPRMCIPSFHFGVINIAGGVTPVSQRHGFSEGLLGSSFTWTYNDFMVSQHYYATPDSLYYGIIMDGETVLMWSCDAWYVKFRENVYLISWLESFGSGQNDTKIFNLNTLHDAGVCYGIPDPGQPGEEVFEYNTFGSEARHAGTVDVSSIYGKSVTYESNGGTGTLVTDSALYAPGVSVTVKGVGDVTRAGYTFAGWNTAANGSGIVYRPGEAFIIDADTTLYAQWTRVATGGGSISGGSSVATYWEPPDEITTTPNETPFTDAAGHWGYEDIKYAYEAGWLNGTSANKFSPDIRIERGMIVTALWWLAGSPAPTALAPFDDVEAGAYYAQAVAWAAEHDIVNGVGGGLFAPLRQVTREQVATILYRYAQYRQYDVSAQGSLNRFPDAASISGYEDARASAAWAVGAELLRGRASGALDPLGTATRAELAALLHRFHLSFATPAAGE